MRRWTQLKPSLSYINLEVGNFQSIEKFLLRGKWISTYSPTILKKILWILYVKGHNTCTHVFDVCLQRHRKFDDTFLHTWRRLGTNSYEFLLFTMTINLLFFWPLKLVNFHDQMGCYDPLVSLLHDRDVIIQSVHNWIKKIKIHYEKRKKKKKNKSDVKKVHFFTSINSPAVLSF